MSNYLNDWEEQLYNDIFNERKLLEEREDINRIEYLDNVNESNKPTKTQIEASELFIQALNSGSLKFEPNASFLRAFSNLSYSEIRDFLEMVFSNFQNKITGILLRKINKYSSVSVEPQDQYPSDELDNSSLFPDGEDNPTMSPQQASKEVKQEEDIYSPILKHFGSQKDEYDKD